MELSLEILKESPDYTITTLASNSLDFLDFLGV